MFRVFFASDIHASDVVFRKFLNASNYYKADVLIYGGDITGKALIFIEKSADGTYHADFLGTHEVVSEGELDVLVTKIMDRGYYYTILERDQIERVMRSKVEMQKIMMNEMIRRVEGWVDLAKKLYSNSSKRVYLLLGNDDPRDVLDPIRNAGNDNIVDVNERTFTLDSGIEGFGIPYANMTPWKLPGDIPEDELQIKIDALASTLTDVKNSIFLIHVPPINTAIDEAPKLQDLKLKVDVTGIEMAHVGSTAVRGVIEKYQPMLTLHGHIHESRGVARIGRTLCVNPGSEYEQGILRGAVINIDEKAKKIRSHLLVSG